MAKTVRPAGKLTSPIAARKTGRMRAVAAKVPGVIVPGDSVGSAFDKITRGCLAQLREHQHSVLARGDAAGIHKMRVAIRRLRAAFALFQRIIGPHALAELKPELRWLAGELAQARDWSVFREETLASRANPAAAARPAQRLRKLTAGPYAIAQRRAIAAVGSPRYAALILALSTWIEAEQWRAGANARRAAQADRPIDKLAPALLRRRARKLHKAARSIADLSVEERHALRKRLKALRYSANFLAVLFKGRQVGRYLAVLGVMQDMLGTINDLAVAKMLLTTLRAEARGTFGNAFTLLDAAFAAQLIDKLGRLPAAWHALKKTRPFWD